METNSKTLWAIYNNPRPLLQITNHRVREAIDEYLPYSTGMEIECMHGENFDGEVFKSIRNIVDVYNNSELTEQRYRIPSGLQGLVCLWDICEQLKLNCTYHPESGHHYHVDCTDVYDSMTGNFLRNNSEWILKELDEWGYTGEYNTRTYGGWYSRGSGKKTIEFRCGDMSFDYPVIVKRIIHANMITKALKIRLIVDYEKIQLAKLQEEMKELHSKELIKPKELDLQIARTFVKSRTIKL